MYIDADANNYNPDANIDDESCTYDGCVYEHACNYPNSFNAEGEPQADHDDGSCIFDCLFIGCTDAGAINYDAVATEDDGLACSQVVRTRKA